ncbi:MAG: [protein-PII] uridylyltransferase [Pseudomonadota bacterium]
MSRLLHDDLLKTRELDERLATHSSEADFRDTMRDALENARIRLWEFHLEGGSSATSVRHYTWFIDQLMLRVWRFSDMQHSTLGSACLLAVGGYGRKELNLGSDIDLLILLPDNASKEPAPAVELFVRLCWDLGLKIGHGARTCKACLSLAKTDITVMTTMMESRYLTGSHALSEEFDSRLRQGNLWPAGKYFKHKLAEQESRHLQYGDTAYNLEPNIKESPGGLRDLHMIGWVANRYFNTSDLGELVEHGFLTQQEYNTLIKGRNFLWRLRNGLHILAKRAEDRLLFDYQNDLAVQLGYRQGENHLAVESMMKKYYRTVKELQVLNELLLQHFQEAILVRRKPRIKNINRRFQSVGEFVETTAENTFERSPLAIMELFYVLQLNPKLKGVRASTLRQLRQNLQLIDDKYRKDLAHRMLFLEMFKHQEGLTHSLRRMNAYGVLGRFFPEFGKIVGQMQHDLFHVYTVDAHSLFVVRNLRRLMVAQHRNEFPLLTELISKQNKRERLFLAALCHDIGKGSGRDHSEVGEEIALKLCHSLELSEYDSRFVSWLVRHHLVMSSTAQREDISDPRVIDRFAELMGDQEHLDNLYLLTFADIRGTSPKVWTEWKGRLLANLYSATSRRIRSGLNNTVGIQERIDARKQEIRTLVKGEVSDKALNQLWSVLNEEYFIRNGPETSAWHARVISQAKMLEVPLVAVRHRPEIQAQQILVMAPENENLLLYVTAAMDKHEVNVMDARIHQTRSGMTLLIFIVADTNQQGSSSKWLQEHTLNLRQFILSNPQDYRPAQRILPRAVKQFEVPIEVNFINSQNVSYTTMEIVCKDRPGLLYQVARTLKDSKIRLLSAKVSTVGEKAEDTFFITDRDGVAISDEKTLLQLQERMRKNLDSPYSKP